MDGAVTGTFADDARVQKVDLGCACVNTHTHNHIIIIYIYIIDYVFQITSQTQH